jgi:8-oxo-dGTP diphosphatase
LDSTYVNWGGSRVKLTWQKGDTLPPRNLITSVHGFCFLDEKLLLVKLNHRGWDMTGGHIEPDESPVECFKRETLEEAYVEGNCHLLGWVTVDHSENSTWNENSPYPKVGYQIFYRMEITKAYEFEARYESTDRIFIDPNRVREYYADWHEIYDSILISAIEKNRLKPLGGNRDGCSYTKQPCVGQEG